MARTGARNSTSTVAALAAGGTILLLVGAALGQGVQGPNTFQGGTGGVAPTGVNPPGSLINNSGANPAGALNAYNKGGVAPIDLQSGAMKAAPPASPTKAVGAEPPPSPAKGVGAQGANTFSPRDAASTPTPRKAGTKDKIGDIKAKIGDIKGVGSAKDCATGAHAC